MKVGLEKGYNEFTKTAVLSVYMSIVMQVTVVQNFEDIYDIYIIVRV